MALLQFVGVNVALTTANNEYTLVLPPGAINLQLKMSDATHTAQIYTVSVGNAGTPANSFTIGANQIISFVTRSGGQTLYVMPNTSNTVLQGAYYLDQ